MLLGRLRPRQVLINAGLLAAITLSTSLTWVTEALAVGAVAKARASGGQPELLVGFDPQGILRAKSNTGSGENLAQGVALSVPLSLQGNQGKAKFEIVPIGEQRHAIVVTIPTELPNRPWQALVVAKPGKPEPEILFQGFTGLIEGEDGLRRGPVLEISEAIDESGARRIVLGETREDLTLCGRRTTLAPKMLSPKELALKPAKLQRLSIEERERAPKLVAEPHAAATDAAVIATDQPQKTPGDPQAPGAANTDTSAPAVTHARAQLGGHASLLRPLGASSAIGWPASLTDGDPETTWAENRGGTGRGEFVTFRAPSDVPLQSFRFVIKPAKREIPKGAGPEQLWLVTNSNVFSVRFPSDPWKAPLVSWRVALPAPVQTDCVAIVTETAFGEKPDSEVTLAEVAADSEFASASIEQLVGALAGGGTRAEAAGSVLSALGPGAQAAVAAAFDSLDEGGRRVALDVLDHAPCGESSPVYIKALLGNTEAHQLHAIDRLRRCGPTVVPPIEQALGKQPSLKQRALLELFSEVAPDRAIAYLAPRLTGSVKTRRMLRELLAQASRSPKAPASVRTQLAATDLPKTALVDLLRALGKQIETYADVAAPRLERLLENEADWKTRYLLMAPAHRLAKHSTTLAHTLATLMRTDPKPEVRLEAVRAVEQVELFTQELLVAVSDPEVRVREAATQVLSSYRDPRASSALAARLNDDPWPLVRAQAAESLAVQPANANADKALVNALDDKAWVVRVAVAEALGKKRLSASGASLLEHFDDKNERFEVRVAAASSLGQLCYEPAIDSLTSQARKLKAPGMDMRDRAVAASALNALGELHPTDLAQRLDPLLSNKDVPPEIRQAAKAALSSESPCQLPKSPATARTETH